MEPMDYDGIKASIPEKVESDDQYNELFEKSTERETTYLQLERIRGLWHGTAYLSLTTKKQKYVYRRKFGLTQKYAERLANMIRIYGG